MTARLFISSLSVSAVVLASCGARPPAVPQKAPASDPDRVAIIAAERGPSGARLVAIDEHGDRRHVMLAEASGTVRDTNPAASPDGNWMVFASSRGRPLDQTSLWIAPIGVEVAPVQITSGAAIDSHPAWNRAGSAIVFASTRDGGDFDLWQLAIENGRVRGAPEQLTNGAAHEVTPTVARDGTVIYASVTPLEDRSIESHLEQRAPDGTITKLTDGPTDTSPALSPDERTVAFARTVVHDGTPNTELWLLRRTDGKVERIVELPPTDESGPVWSRDGELIFATSLMRGTETALFSSVIFVDLAEKPPRARILEDHAGGIARLTPAIVAPQLDVSALRADPEYLPELARIMSNAVEQAKQLHPETP
jgi:Tol biopolymer transport system component